MRHNLIAGVLIFLISTVFTIRVITFASTFGAIEHDSGWLLGVAKNLSMRGIYASYTNLVDQDGIGVFPSIHGRESAQDTDGYIYFPELISVGPGYIIPQAVFLKFFGYGYWQYRIFPLLSFFFLLLIVLAISYYISGITSVVLVSIWMYLIPQITLQFAYEAFGEHIALLYLLISFCLFCLAVSRNYSKSLSFLSGLFFSFSFLTKTIFILNGISIICVGLFEIYRTKKIKYIYIMCVFFLLGFLLPYITFETYRYVSLRNIFGIDGYNSVNNSLRWVILNNGSGLNLGALPDTQFIIQKLGILKELGIKNIFVGWILLILSIAGIHGLNGMKKNMFILLWISMMTSSVWYVLVSPTGWGRHVWYGLLIGMILSTSSITKLDSIKRRINIFLLVILFSIFCNIMSSTFKMHLNFSISQTHLDFLNDNRYLYDVQGFPSVPFFSYEDQSDIVKHFNEHIHSNDSVHYLGWFLVAELSPLVDKVFYPFSRYVNNSYGHEKNGNQYIIVGPYQKGRIKVTSDEYLIEKTQALCSDIVYENDSYLLCTIKPELTQDEIEVGLANDY